MIRTLILATAIAVPAAAAAMPPAGTYTYSVKHPDHGDVGTYSVARGPWSARRPISGR